MTARIVSELSTVRVDKRRVGRKKKIIETKRDLLLSFSIFIFFFYIAVGSSVLFPSQVETHILGQKLSYKRKRKNEFLFL